MGLGNFWFGFLQRCRAYGSGKISNQEIDLITKRDFENLPLNHYEKVALLKLKAPKSLQTATPKFEEVVKSAQDAAVLVLVY